MTIANNKAMASGVTTLTFAKSTFTLRLALIDARSLKNSRDNSGSLISDNVAGALKTSGGRRFLRILDRAGSFPANARPLSLLQRFQRSRAANEAFALRVLSFLHLLESHSFFTDLYE